MTWRLLLRILAAFVFGILVYANAQRKDEDHILEMASATANNINSGQPAHLSNRPREMDVLSLMVAEVARQASRNWRAGHTIRNSVRLAIVSAKASTLLRRAYVRKA